MADGGYPGNKDKIAADISIYARAPTFKYPANLHENAKCAQREEEADFAILGRWYESL